MSAAGDMSAYPTFPPDSRADGAIVVLLGRRGNQHRPLRMP